MSILANMFVKTFSFQCLSARVKSFLLFLMKHSKIAKVQKAADFFNLNDIRFFFSVAGTERNHSPSSQSDYWH